MIRGAYVGDAKAAALDTEFQKGKVRRIAELYEDSPHHWMLVEIDNFYPRCRDPVADPVGSIDEFLQRHIFPLASTAQITIGSYLVARGVLSVQAS